MRKTTDPGARSFCSHLQKPPSLLPTNYVGSMTTCDTRAEARTAIAAAFSVNYFRRHRPPGSLINFPGALKLCGVRNRHLPLGTSGCRTTPAAATHNRDIYIIGRSGR